MKRSPLRRKTPLARKPMRRGKRRTKYARRERDSDRRDWIWAQPCAVWSLYSIVSGAPLSTVGWRGPEPDLCSGRVEAHHAGVHGMGNKAPDDTYLPMCTMHHRALTDRTGCFSGWPRGSLKEWELDMVSIYQAHYAAHLAGLREVAA